MAGTLSKLVQGARMLKYLVEDLREGRKRVSLAKRSFGYHSLRKVRISSHGKFERFVKLQTPGGLGVWKSTICVPSRDREIDLVINRHNPFLKLHKEVERNWLLHIEPPGYIEKLKLRNGADMERYGKVFTSSPELIEKGGKFIASPPYVHWHLAVNAYTVGQDAAVYDYDFLLNCDEQKVLGAKQNQMSTINSNVNDLPGHRLRADFVSNLCSRGMKLNLYGHPYWARYGQYKGRANSGKWPAYLTSKYVLVIENEISPYYWTEKFTDAILCYCIPIYYGSTKISEYFPEGSYIPLDINKLSAFDDIQDIIDSDFYEKNWDKLLQARDLVLTTHNLFNFIDQQMTNIN
jgi:hypothetical protein